MHGKNYFEVDDYGMMKKFLADKMMMFDLLNLCFCIEKFERIYIIFPVFCTNPINRNDSQKVNLKHPFVQSNQQKLYICLNANQKSFQGMMKSILSRI